MRRGAVLIRCLTTDDTGGDVITNEPEHDAGHADKDTGRLCAAGAVGARKADRRGL